MKKFLTVLFLILIFISCSTTEEIVPPEDVIIEEDTGNEYRIVETVEVYNPPLVEEEPVSVEEAPLSVVEDAVTEDMPVSDAVNPVDVEEKIEPEVVEDISRPVNIVEEISEMITEPSGTETEESVTISSEDVPPAVEEEVPVVIPSQEETSGSFSQRSVLDSEISDEILFVMVELIVVVFIFTLSSVIRNKFQRPLPMLVAVILTLLFVSIPMLVSVVILGWDNLLLIYLVLLICLVVFRSKDNRI